MSFTGEVVEELVHSAADTSEECQLAEFAAFVFASGYLRLGAERNELVIRVARPAAARRLLKLGRTIFNFEVGPLMYTETAFEKWYEVSFSAPDLTTTLINHGLLKPDLTIEYISRNQELIKDRACKNAFMRGIFLAAGYVAHPSSGRHLELHISSREAAELILKMLKEEGYRVHMLKRRHRYIVYLKNYQDIKDLFYKIGAVQASFKFENQQLIRELKNDVNRRVNFEKANLERTTSSSLRQLQAIIFIDETVGIDSLPPALKEAAMLRLKNPHASIAELAEMMNGVTTKSGAANRLKRLEKIAAQLSERRKED